MLRRILLAATCTMVSLLAPSLFAATHDVTVGNNFFSPNDLTITVGDTVRWTNSTGVLHDVTADDFSWASQTSGNFVYERTFNTVEEVLYHCTVHSQPGRDIDTFMNGRINVVESTENQPPTADFSANCTDLDCAFTDQSTDSDGAIASRDWDFGDGNGSTAANPNHSYASAGTYDVMLTVTDDGGAMDSVTMQVTVSAPANQSPVADFAFSCTDLQCGFTDQSSDPDGSIASWSWNFGDGNSSSDQNPQHGYAEGGSYNVVLTVTDDAGATDARTRVVTVSGPAAEFLINAGISDAWFSPTTDGQGFFIIVWEDNGLIFLSWFTYDTERPPADVTALLGEPGHRWLTAQGPYSGDTAMLDVFLTSGGVFDAAEPMAETSEPIGTITIVWTGCNSGTLTYEIPSLGLSGMVAIERIVLDKVPDCEAAQP